MESCNKNMTITNPREREIDENDPYFYSSVPMYHSHLGIDNDDTIGDAYFDTPDEMLGLVSTHPGKNLADAKQAELNVEEKTNRPSSVAAPPARKSGMVPPSRRSGVRPRKSSIVPPAQSFFGVVPQARILAAAAPIRRSKITSEMVPPNQRSAIPSRRTPAVIATPAQQSEVVAPDRKSPVSSYGTSSVAASPARKSGVVPPSQRSGIPPWNSSVIKSRTKACSAASKLVQPPIQFGPLTKKDREQTTAPTIKKGTTSSAVRSTHRQQQQGISIGTTSDDQIRPMTRQIAKLNLLSTPKIVQPPMRFGRLTDKDRERLTSSAARKSTTSSAVCSTHRQQQQGISIGTTSDDQVRPMTRQMAKLNLLATPKIVQPPMRFGWLTDKDRERLTSSAAGKRVRSIKCHMRKMNLFAGTQGIRSVVKKN